MRRVLVLFTFILLLSSMVFQPVAAAQTVLIPGQIAFTRDGDLWIWDARAERRITEGGGVSSPRYSSDGRYVAFTQNGALWVVRPGTTAWRVASSTAPANWAPTENTLALVEKGGVFTVRITDDGPRPPHVLAKGWSDPAWSPDGRLVALTRNTNRENFSGTAEVGVASTSGGDPRIIWKGAYSQDDWMGPATGLKWSADRQWLAFYRAGLTPSFSADRNQLVVLPLRGDGVTAMGFGPMNRDYFEWAPTGATLAFTDGEGRFAWGDKRIKLVAMPPKNNFQSPTLPGHADREPAWSPGGEYLYFVRSVAQSPNRMYQPAHKQAVWRLALKTGEQRVVPGTEDALGVTVSPSGRLLWPKGDGKTGSLWTVGQGVSVRVVSQIDFPGYYYGQFYWGEVFDWWSGER